MAANSSETAREPCPRCQPRHQIAFKKTTDSVMLSNQVLRAMPCQGRERVDINLGRGRAADKAQGPLRPAGVILKSNQDNYLIPRICPDMSGALHKPQHVASRCLANAGLLVLVEDAVLRLHGSLSYIVLSAPSQLSDSLSSSFSGDRLPAPVATCMVSIQTSPGLQFDEQI